MKLACPHCGAMEQTGIIEQPGAPLCGNCRRGIPGGRPLFVIETYLLRQRIWSLRTFGEGARTEGVTKHIEKELAEIRAKPHDLTEWIDVIILALDGFWRAGGQPGAVMDYLQAKQNVNFQRSWPPAADGEPAEHDRTQDAPQGPRVYCKRMPPIRDKDRERYAENPAAKPCECLEGHCMVTAAGYGDPEHEPFFLD